MKTEAIPRDEENEALTSLKAVCEKIRSVVEKLKIEKRDGRIVAQGWNDSNFAVVLNENKEIGERPEPSYSELKQSDGIRLLVRLLYEGMQE